jgi:inosine-uridine nucleoside N-ribohydrolase
VHDALCTAYLVDRDVVTTQALHVRVETQGALTVGRTVMDTRTHAPGPPNCRVAFDADDRRFVELLVETFGRVSAS